MENTPCFVTSQTNAYYAAKDRGDAQMAEALQTLRAEFIDGWKASPLTKIRTPDWHVSEATVEEVVFDYLQGIGPEYDAARLQFMQIIIKGATGQSVAAECSALVRKIAEYHSNFHADAFCEGDDL